jgi:hypothetical protein
MKKLFENWRSYIVEEKNSEDNFSYKIVGLLYFLSKDKDPKSEFKKVAYWVENKKGDLSSKAKNLLIRVREVVKQAKPKEAKAMLELGKKWKVKMLKVGGSVRTTRTGPSKPEEIIKIDNIKYRWVKREQPRRDVVGGEIKEKRFEDPFWIVTMCLEDICAEGKAKGATTSSALKGAEANARANLSKKLKGSD